MFNTDVGLALERLRFILNRPLDAQGKISTSVAQYIKRLSDVQSFYLLRLNSDGSVTIISEILNKSEKLELNWLRQNLQDIKGKGPKIGRPTGVEQAWTLTVPVRGAEGEIYATAMFSNSTFVENFYSPKLQNYYLINNEKKVFMSPIHPPHAVSEEVLASIMDKLDWEERAATQVKEIQLAKESYLVASVSTSVAPYFMMSVIPKSVALEALKVISVKTGLLVLFILGVAIVVSVLGASRLTYNISQLYEAVNKIIGGDLNTKVKIESKDEIGVLATGFNLMTDKIQELLKETAEKARMEGELKTAQTVQSMLFPSNYYLDERIEVSGFYEPASECGGDWYNYNVLEDRAYFWIGDATGHGVSAALITSAAKSAATVIQNMSGLKTSEIMSYLNQSIAASSGGQVLMTFFVGCLEFKTGRFTFTNASHDTPYLLKPQEGESYKRKHVTPIIGNQGARLGEDPLGVFEESELQITPGDRLIFYTDGLTEVTNSEKQQWGDGKFLRSLVSAFNNHKELQAITENILKDAYTFRGNEMLHDDVTFFAFEFKSQS